MLCRKERGQASLTFWHLFPGVSYSGVVLIVVFSLGFLTVDFPLVLAQFSDGFNLLGNF